MPQRPKKLTPTSHTAVIEFAQAAQHWGLEQEWGTGTSVDRAEQTYNETREALIKRIAWLEEQARKLRREKNALRSTGMSAKQEVW